MDSLNIPRNSGEVFFGQLLGMCDQVTFPLGQAGYSVYKVIFQVYFQTFFPDFSEKVLNQPFLQLVT